MSAFWLPIPIVCKQLGIPEDEVEYIRMPSLFPPEIRPIIINPVADLTRDKMDEEVPKLIKEIKAILKSHPHDKGIIHAVSYSLANKIKDGVKSDRIITHNGQDRMEVLNKFIASPDCLVLLSPSMERGVSLDGDKARFQIIAKMPFLSLANKVTAGRVYGGGPIGKQWYVQDALGTVLQMCGRIVRGAGDYGETYILDQQFQRIYTQFPLSMPKYWRDAVVW